MATIPLLLGHRGAPSSGSVAENTFAAFDLALARGCDGFEFDVRLTGCGRALVCHDPKVGGVTVARATARQLTSLPQLHEVLVRYGQRVFLDIELKVKGLEPLVLAALRKHPPGRNYVVSSFLSDVLLELKVRSARVPVGIICDREAQLAKWRNLPVDYVIAHRSLVKRELAGEVHAAGKKLIVWTVNDKRSILRLAEYGADAIITDRTQAVMSIRGEQLPRPSA
ncbi:MAG: glycerophosphodiester phosphodiesterase [Acidobacteriia bacterium]|nr:glycerophosphodiester phosphodiesterase [Terriglobia bacterium]